MIDRAYDLPSPSRRTLEHQPQLIYYLPWPVSESDGRHLHSGARGFVYLAVVLDSFSRRLLSCRPSITLQTTFRVESPGRGDGRHGKPDIFNTNQYEWRQTLRSDFLGLDPRPERKE